MPISEADYAYWVSALRAIVPLEDGDLAGVAAHLASIEVPAGGAYLRAGETPYRVGLVRTGVLREAFLLADGGERTRGFGVEGDFAGSLSDLLRGGPARTSVTAEEPARVLSVPWAVVTEAVGSRASWRLLLHRITERLYLTKAEREYELLGLDAEERYRRFRERHPGLEARVTQRHVASYLGITPEHLSRIRARARAR